MHVHRFQLEVLCVEVDQCVQEHLKKNTHNQVFTFTQLSPVESELPAVLPPTDVPPLFVSQSSPARSPKAISNDTCEQSCHVG